MAFYDELKRHNVVRVGIAYVVVAWLLAQVADQHWARSAWRTGCCARS
jgi:hypothetical protein